MSMYYYALSKDPGTGVVYTYDNRWDSYRIQGCLCDTAYFGSDCSLRVCPTGDDPLTGNGASTAANPTQYNEVQRITCAAGGGTFTLAFEKATTLPIEWDANVAAVQKALQALTTVEDVKVVMYGVQACMESGASFTVEFLQNFGNLPLLVGNTSRLYYSDGSRQPKLLIAKQQVGTKENAFCSGRGICDTSIGACTCSVGYITSNGYAAIGTRGDCGDPTANIQNCPGLISCSGHGQCLQNPTYVCACETGWQGADCSQRSCPSDIAWFDKPSGDDVAHLNDYVECSGKGNCDRTSGICVCEPQFSGIACNRLYCSSINAYDCSGHGACYDMQTLATINAAKLGNPLISYGTNPNDPATWDAKRIFGCVCNPFWTSFDCSQRTCPIGVDPETVTIERQSLTCTIERLSGSPPTVSMSILGNNFSVPATINTDNLQGILSSFLGVGTIVVKNNPGAPNVFCTEQTGAFLIEFPTLRVNRPLISLSATYLSGLVVGTYELQKGAWQTGECSNRGLCNRANGICSCFTGYGTSDGNGNIGTLPDCGYRTLYTS